MPTTGYKEKKKLKGSKEDLEGIKAALRDFYKGLSEHDLETLSINTTQDFYLLEHGEYWSLDYTKFKIGNTKPPGYSRSNTFDFKLIEVFGDDAFAVWDLRADVIREGTENQLYWIESGSLKKNDGIWKVHILHSTRATAEHLPA